MADAYDLLLSALLKDEGSYQTENPFYSAGTGIDAVLATMPKYHLKPWEAALAGALGGFGSGVLKGIGTASADQKTASIAEKLAGALGGDDPVTALKADPELAKYAPIAQIKTLQDKFELDKQKREALAKALLSPPQMRTVINGLTETQQEYNPLTQQWKDIGSGQRFAPSASVGNQPVNSELIQALVDSGNLDPSIGASIKTQSDAALAQRTIANQGVQSRSDRTFEQGKKKSALFGYEPIDDSVVLDTADVTKYRQKIAAIQDVKGKLESLAGKDLTQIAGQDAQSQAATAALLFQSFRNMTGSGANLTANEVGLINDMSPALAAGNLTEALKRGALGRDQNVFAKDLSKMLQDGLDTEIFSLGLKRKGKDLASYPKSLRETMGIDAPDASKNIGGALEIPKRLPGESVSDYKARTGL